MQVWRFELQHLVDPVAIDTVRCIPDFFRGTIRTTKPCADYFFTIFLQQLEGLQMGTGGDLDQLGETVSDLSLWQGPQEGEVKKRVHRRVVSAQSVFIIAVVNSNLD